MRWLKTTSGQWTTLLLLSLGLLAVSYMNMGLAATPAPQARQKNTAAGSKANKPFVIKETYWGQAPQPSTEDSKGVVGLDMLIEPNRYPVIQRVFPGTPAHSQGIRIGDTILAINGVRTVNQSLWALDQLISDIPGEVVSFTLLRDGRLRKVNLTVMPLSEANAKVKSNFSGFQP